MQYESTLLKNIYILIRQNPHNNANSVDQKSLTNLNEIYYCGQRKHTKYRKNNSSEYLTAAKCNPCWHSDEP